MNVLFGGVYWKYDDICETFCQKKCFLKNK